jgi:hypothetical protein
MNMISRYNPEYDAKPWLNQKAAPKPAGAIDVPMRNSMAMQADPGPMRKSMAMQADPGPMRKSRVQNPWIEMQNGNAYRHPDPVYKGGPVLPYVIYREPDLPKNGGGRDFTAPGENGGGVTLAFPENGGGRPRYDQPVTTLAIPENGGGDVITLAFPENGGGDIGLPIVGGSGPITTQAIPENGGGDVITLAFPENGLGTPPVGPYAAVQNPWLS